MIERGRRKDLPEVSLPSEVFAGLTGQSLMFDDYRMLGLGCRMSPVGVRSFLLAAIGGFHDEFGYHKPVSFGFRLNAILYAWFNDFVDDEEFQSLLHFKGINGNLSHSDSDLLIGPYHYRLENKVCDTVDAVALDIEKRRKENGDLRVLLVHGKWNSIPHLGHLFCLRDVVQEAAAEYQCDARNLVLVVLSDTNRDINQTGTIPFINTFWRVSLMSYWPYVDYVCPSGEFPADREKADRHWLRIYQVLRPDMVNIASDNPNKERIYDRVRQVGARPVEFNRDAQWPVAPGLSGAKMFAGAEVSSRGLRKGSVDKSAFTRTVQHVLAIKKIRDELYGPRDWFGHEGVILPDKGRGLTPEVLRPGLDLPSPELALRLTGQERRSVRIPEFLSVTGLVEERQHQILADVLRNYLKK